MADAPAHDDGKRRGNVSLAIFFVLFVLFTANVLLGKAGIAFGWKFPFLLGDVAEFLLLLLAALFFMRTALAAERTDDGKAGVDRPD